LGVKIRGQKAGLRGLKIQPLSSKEERIGRSIKERRKKKYTPH